MSSCRRTKQCCSCVAALESRLPGVRRSRKTGLWFWRVQEIHQLVFKNDEYDSCSVTYTYPVSSGKSYVGFSARRRIHEKKKHASSHTHGRVSAVVMIYLSTKEQGNQTGNTNDYNWSDKREGVTKCSVTEYSTAYSAYVTMYTLFYIRIFYRLSIVRAKKK